MYKQLDGNHKPYYGILQKKLNHEVFHDSA